MNQNYRSGIYNGFTKSAGVAGSVVGAGRTIADYGARGVKAAWNFAGKHLGNAGKAIEESSDIATQANKVRFEAERDLISKLPVEKQQSIRNVKTVAALGVGAGGLALAGHGYKKLTRRGEGYPGYPVYR